MMTDSLSRVKREHKAKAKRVGVFLRLAAPLKKRLDKRKRVTKEDHADFAERAFDAALTQEGL